MLRTDLISMISMYYFRRKLQQVLRIALFSPTEQVHCLHKWFSKVKRVIVHWLIILVFHFLSNPLSRSSIAFIFSVGSECHILPWDI